MSSSSYKNKYSSFDQGSQTSAPSTQSLLHSDGSNVSHHNQESHLSRGSLRINGDDEIQQFEIQEPKLKKTESSTSVQSKEEEEQEDQQEALSPDQSTKGLIKYGCQQKARIGFGLFCLLGGLLVEVSVPYYGSRIISLAGNQDERGHTLLQEESWRRIRQYALTLLIIVVVSSIGGGLRGYHFNVASERIAQTMRGDLFYKIIQQEVGYFDKNKTGDLLSRLSSDISIIQEGLTTNVSMFVRSVLFITAAMIILFATSWKLALFIFAMFIPITVFIFIFGNIMKKLQVKVQTAKAKMTGTSQEAIANARTVKAFSTQEFQRNKYSMQNLKVFFLGRTMGKMYGIMIFVITLLMWGSVIGILYVGALLVKENEISSGNITFFILTLIQLMMNFGILSSVIGAVMRLKGASIKIMKILNRRPKIVHNQGIQCPHSEGEIILENVTFAYPTKPKVQVLKNISLKIKSGTVVALVGSSGGGKSSIVGILERFYDPKNGRILFDNKDIRELDPRWYHKQVSLVSQQPVLFSGSIKDNIAYGIECTEAQIINAAKMANAYDFIMDRSKFPKKFDTIVGERGVLLSGGQKQRVAIARALIRKPKVIVLDEATSALDAESQHLVQQALDNLMQNGGQTVVVIAHRLSTIKDADVIVVLNSGEIVEKGKHQDLLDMKGFYYKLIKRQVK